MAITVTANINSSTTATIQSGAALSTTFTGSPSIAFSRAFNSTELTKSYFNNYTVTSTPTSIDLTSLTDAYGTAISFATVRVIHIYNHDTAITLTAGGGSNPIVSTLPLLVGYTASSGSNGSDINICTNITVDGTHRYLALTAASGSISVDVMILGA